MMEAVISSGSAALSATAAGRVSSLHSAVRRTEPKPLRATIAPRFRQTTATPFRFQNCDGHAQWTGTGSLLM
jgi:hypothetical protein